MAALIEVNHLVKTYTMGQNMVHALRGVTTVIASGDFVAITTA